jgi:hypothetical protein
VTVNISTISPHVKHVSEPEAISFTVQDTGGVRGEDTRDWPGVMRPMLHWQTTPIKEELRISLSDGVIWVDGPGR